jgi:uncharacterized GH25 family protein
MARASWRSAWVVAIAVAACGDQQTVPTDARREAEAPAQPVSAPTAPAAVPPIRVRVTDAAGASLAGVRVVARSAPGESHSEWPGMQASSLFADWQSQPPSWETKAAAEGVTQADGTTSLGGLAAGVWRVAVDAPGRVARGATCNLSAGGDAPEVVIASEAAHRFEGRVLTPAGAPVAGAVVAAQFAAVAASEAHERRGGDAIVVRAGPDGRFSFDGLPAGYAWIRCGPPGGWSSHVWTVRVESVHSLDLVLEGRGPVHGVVRTVPDGKPLAGAHVVYSISGWHTAKAFAHAVTDAEGRYRIEVFPGEAVTSVEVAAPGMWRVPRVVGARQPPFQLYPDRPTELDLAVHADAPEFADVRGVVRGPDGPVAGAEVFLVARDPVNYISPTFRTDATGRFWFFGVPRACTVLGTNTVSGLYLPGVQRLSSDGGTAREADPSLVIDADAPRPVERDLTFARGGTVTGRVVDAEGRPVAGAKVYGDDGISTETGDDGAFRLVGFGEPAEMTVSASRDADGLSGESKSFTAGAGADATGIEIVVRRRPDPVKQSSPSTRSPEEGPPGTLRGTVLCGAAPIAGAVITVERDRDSGGIACSFDEDPALPIVAVTDAKGAFEVARFEAGKWTLHAAARGYLGGEASTELVAAGEASVSITVEREAHLRGRALHADGRPVSGARVDVSRVQPEDADADAAIGLGDWSAVAGPDGAFDVAVPDSVRCSVEVSPGWHDGADEFLPTRAGPFAAPCEPVEIRVDEGESIAGRVLLADGSPAAGIDVTCSPTGDDEEYDERSATTAADGTYSLVALTPGSHDVKFSQGLAAPVVVKDVRSGRRDADARLAPRKSVEGVLLDADGRPASGRTLVASVDAREGDGDERPSVTATTGPDGRFRIEGVGDAPFRVDLGSGRRSGTYLDQEGSLVGGGSVKPGATDVVLSIPTKDALTVAGRVVDDAGRPVAGVEVTIPISESVLMGNTSDEDGRFSTSGVSLHEPCDVKASAGGIDWTIPVPAGTKDLVLVVGDDGLHRVRIGERDVSVARAEVEVEDDDANYGTARFVPVAGGAPVEVESNGDRFHVDELRVGAYRIEVRGWDRNSPWRATRLTRENGRTMLVVGE